MLIMEHSRVSQNHVRLHSNPSSGLGIIFLSHQLFASSGSVDLTLAPLKIVTVDPTLRSRDWRLR